MKTIVAGIIFISITSHTYGDDRDTQRQHKSEKDHAKTAHAKEECYDFRKGAFGNQPFKPTAEAKEMKWVDLCNLYKYPLRLSTACVDGVDVRIQLIPDNQIVLHDAARGWTWLKTGGMAKLYYPPQ